jgi:RNA polymerase sigma-70 factor, ECF subfamily
VILCPYRSTDRGFPNLGHRGHGLACSFGWEREINLSTPEADANAIENEKIVVLILGGNPEGEELLYRQYRRGLMFLAKRHCPLQAEDCVQEAVMTAIQQIKKGRLENPAALPGYLTTILRRIALETRQKEQRRSGDQESFEVRVQTIHDRRENPERAFQIQQQAELMQAGLRQLKPAQREILTRFYLAGQTPAQICEEMGLTETQFRLHKSRSKQVLQESVSRSIKVPVGSNPSRACLAS